MTLINVDVTENIHRAAQYLAAAGINYLEKKDDDSHTNFGWDNERKAFITRNLNGNKLYLSFNLQNYRLEFLRKDKVLASKPLAGSKHQDILDWLSEVFRDLSFDSPFKFNLHYELPYSQFSSEFVFENTDIDELQFQSSLRETAYKSIQQVTSNFDQKVEVRTWPHHLDTGAFIALGGEFGIGLGLAIPDNMINDFYYYVSGWKGHEMLSTESLPSLKKGKWMNGNWNGAVLQASNASQEDIQEFLIEAIEYLK